jgi:formylglycine-generating enzyme required for sulfatase activity
VRIVLTVFYEKVNDFFRCHIIVQTPDITNVIGTQIAIRMPPTMTTEPNASDQPFTNTAGQTSQSHPIDRSWIGNLCTTAGLIIGVFVILAFRDRDGGKILVDESAISQLAQVSDSKSLFDNELVMPNDAPTVWSSKSPPFINSNMDTSKIADIQKQWAVYLETPVEFTNSIGMQFMLIPPGEFLMGARQSDIDLALPGFDKNDTHWMVCVQSASPQHRVRITKPFYLSRTEVTQKHYQQVLGTNPSYYSKGGREPVYVQQVSGMDTSDHPVEGVCWFDCLAFCNRLSDMESRRISYEQKNYISAEKQNRPKLGYRLPTEAQWEMACRAGTSSRYWTGEDPLESDTAGWHGKKHASRSHKVGEKMPNPFGLYDVNDNVWEWVEDRFDPDYYHQCSNQLSVDPLGSNKTTTLRIVRGGLWPDSYTASCERYIYESDYQCNYVGFRVVLPIAVKTATD